MATPVYNAAWRNRGGGYRGRTWGIVIGNGSMLGGNTPQYLGTGQPAAEDAGWLSGNGTPIYRSAPSMVTTPSVTPSAATAPQPAPQPGQVAIVVPRS
jgi:hypothetical protein